MLTKSDYQNLYTHLGRLLPFGASPLNAAEVVNVNELREKIERYVAELRPVEEKGEMVLEWRIPREWTAVKSGKGVRPWILETMKRRLGDELRKILPSWKNADLNCARRRRWVQVRRFSDQQPDRPTCADCLGARQAIDLLTGAGVIVDDDPTWTVDDTNWIKCKRGSTHVVIRVFEVVTQGGRSWPEPECLPPPKPEKKTGPMMKAIRDARPVAT